MVRKSRVTNLADRRQNGVAIGWLGVNRLIATFVTKHNPDIYARKLSCDFKTLAPNLEKLKLLTPFDWGNLSCSQACMNGTGYNDESCHKEGLTSSISTLAPRRDRVDASPIRPLGRRLPLSMLRFSNRQPENVGYNDPSRRNQTKGNY